MRPQPETGRPGLAGGYLNIVEGLSRGQTRSCHKQSRRSDASCCCLEYVAACLRALWHGGADCFLRQGSFGAQMRQTEMERVREGEQHH
jgi:hypothetical protein